jgi:uncharacterized protein (DUF2062 family)
VARELFILVLSATIAFFLGDGYYKSFRSSVLTVKGRTYRREKEPIGYWIGMAIGIFGFLVMLSATAVMAFRLCIGLSGTSK